MFTPTVVFPNLKVGSGIMAINKWGSAQKRVAMDLCLWALQMWSLHCLVFHRRTLVLNDPLNYCGGKRETETPVGDWWYCRSAFELETSVFVAMSARSRSCPMFLTSPLPTGRWMSFQTNRRRNGGDDTDGGAFVASDAAAGKRFEITELLKQWQKST